ncbi:phage tail tape measure protein [Serratia entomophila]|uniref:phage tail tape measure protein n=1 Tax=Serratia entomophila TaxID=42906 RepID=UPI001F392855|nr:phage tail tape measure protein [Serratia entomophila]UIW17005.1 phage tail tape measure protein [Serratia entomophila]
MADTALLVVGLQLNDTNFKNKLTAAYRTAGEQSAKFNRQAQQDAKKTDEAYQRIGGTLGGLAGKLAGLAGVELSLQGLAATSRQYGQALTELSSVTVAATAQMKQLDEAARQASSASGEGGSRTEEVLKLAAGLNDSAAAWRDQAAAASGAAQATAGVGAASRVANVALGALGGPVGVAIQAGLAMLYFHEQNQLARKSALELKDVAVETAEDLHKLSKAKLAIKIDSFDEQLSTLGEEKAKIESQLSRLSDTRLAGLERRRKGMLGSLYSDPKELRKERNVLQGQLEDAIESEKAIRLRRNNAVNAQNGNGSHVETKPDNPKGYQTSATPVSRIFNDNGKQQALDQYQQLRQEIEQAHLSSLDKITRDEQSSQTKLASTAKAAGASQAEVQRAMALNAESYQRQRQRLAEQYAPGQATVRKEQEASKELKALYDGRLLTEREYQTASQMQRQETTRQRLKAETDALAAPRLSIAGDVDPAARLSNQLVQQQAQYQAYYQQGYLDKQRYEQLMQAATQESTDAQYQQALSLYGGQNRVHKMALGLVDMTRERTSGMMFDLLTGTQNFKQNMLGLFSSITQSVVQQLIDMAMQALLTRTILSTFMNIGGGLLGGAASAGAGAAGSGAMGMPTGWQGYVPNARGGVYTSPSLSAYSGQVVSSPTLFAFARGAGLMGEAGPEAIMPLKRGADGSLGVQANGITGNSSLINVGITINSDGVNQVQATGGFESAGNDIANYVDQRFRLLLNRSLGQGGTLNRAIKGGR